MAEIILIYPLNTQNGDPVVYRTFTFMCSFLDLIYGRSYGIESIKFYFPFQIYNMLCIVYFYEVR